MSWAWAYQSVMGLDDGTLVAIGLDRLVEAPVFWRFSRVRTFADSFASRASDVALVSSRYKINDGSCSIRVADFCVVGERPITAISGQ